jgi:hypothetical protein
MTAIIVTAADEGYAPLLLDLLHSLADAKLSDDYCVGVVDLGLAAETRAAIAPLVAEVVKPGWPFRPHPKFGAEPRYLSRAVRPFLPRYFPGHEIILWLDADCWVQERAALDDLARCGRTIGAAFVPAADRGYVHSRSSRVWVDRRYRMAFGAAEVEKLASFNYVNSGVFALAAAAPHWAAWERRFQAALDRWTDDFLSDQAILNAVIYLDRFPMTMLPAEYNWLCHLRLPVWSTKSKKLVNPNFPWTRIGVVHNTFNDKQVVVPIVGSDGVQLTTAMTYRAVKALRGGPG